MVFMYVFYAVVAVLLASLRIVNEYERGVKFTLGRYTGMMNPGLRLVIPVIQSWKRVDIRTKAVDVPDQEAMTKDNISAKINAVIYYKIKDAAKSVIAVEDFYYAISQLAQTTMRNIVGELELDDLLSKRDEVALKIREIIDKASDPWGIDVTAIKMQDIELPAGMKRAMAAQAEAEREKTKRLNHSIEVLERMNKLEQEMKLLREK